MTYEQFLQRVRRHRPSDLMVALAHTSVRLFEREAWTADRVRLPWALAAAAKASLVAGNEHRAPGVTDADVAAICGAYNALDTPLAHEPTDATESVGAFLVRTSYEQFPYQQSYFEEISRLSALFEKLDALDTRVLNHALIEEILGCKLEEWTVGGFILATSTQANTGFFDPNWSGVREAIDPFFSADTLRAIFESQFLTDLPRFRAEAKAAEQRDARLRHHEYNPLASRPFITLADGRFIAPQPHFVFQKLSPAALYYAALGFLDNARAARFSEDLGLVFEDYVGRQLRLVPDATVVPEISYDDNKRSVDWFVVFNKLVLLVEAKTTRLTAVSRLGGGSLENDVKRCLGKAYDQITNTNELLNAGHPAFSEIPADRPRLGIAVTLEPYWAANSPFVAEFLPEPQIPTTVASARAFEHLINVLCAKGGPEPLLAVLRNPDRRTWNLENALPDLPGVRNPLLEAAWSKLPFP
jgi:hypothetical protein